VPAPRAIDEHEARTLLELSREAAWTFPSSSGNPVLGDEPWLERLVSEQESFGPAARALDAEEATELAANVWRLWMVSRDLPGGRAFLAPILAVDETPSRARALALYGDGLFAFWQDARDESLELNEAALASARASGDPEALALAHVGLSRVALLEGDGERARELALEARRHAKPLRPAVGQSPLHLHAQALRMLGDYDEAAKLFAESLELNRRIGDPGMIVVELHNLGHVELRRGNADEAERYFGELAEPGADDPFGTAMARLNAAALAHARGDRDRATTLLAQLDATLAESGTELMPDDRAELDWLRGRLAG
jgi:tetratricopeptide (TPR) repeat protein